MHTVEQPTLLVAASREGGAPPLPQPASAVSAPPDGRWDIGCDGGTLVGLTHNTTTHGTFWRCGPARNLPQFSSTPMECFGAAAQPVCDRSGSSATTSLSDGGYQTCRHEVVVCCGVCLFFHAGHIRVCRPIVDTKYASQNSASSSSTSSSAFLGACVAVYIPLCSESWHIHGAIARPGDSDRSKANREDSIQN